LKFAYDVSQIRQHNVYILTGSPPPSHHSTWSKPRGPIRYKPLSCPAIRPFLKDGDTHIRPEILVIILLLLLPANLADLLRRLLLQSLQFRRVNRVDVLLQYRQIDRHFVLVIRVRADDSEVFADFVRALGTP
jgi:hypothetical protein